MIRFLSVAVAGILYVSSLWILVMAQHPSIPANPLIDSPQGKWFGDNFAQDNHLRQNLWEENGPAGRAVAGLWQAQDGGYAVTLVDPMLDFCSGGMMVSGVTGTFQISTIESRSSFPASFTLQSRVMGVEANGNPFALWIASRNGLEGLGITGNLNPHNGGYYGLWTSYPESGGWNALGTRLYSSPSISTVYNLTISVDQTGKGTVNISSNGQNLATANRQVGLGPFYILLVQFEGWPYTIGSNIAIWKSASISASQSPTHQATPPTIFLLQPFTYDLCVSINGVMNPTTAGTVLGPAKWQWGDNTTTTSWFPATHTYTSNGTYRVIVTATDSNGLTATASTIVNLTGSTTPVPPQLSISTTIVNGQTVTVNGLANANACGPALQPFEFSWGDGTATTGWFPQSHTYTMQGAFQVCVTATDSLGESTAQCEPVTV